jgi:hypothetical protein
MANHMPKAASQPDITGPNKPERIDIKPRMNEVVASQFWVYQFPHEVSPFAFPYCYA